MAERRKIFNVHHQAILAQGSSLSFLGGTPKGYKPSGVLVYALLRGVPPPCLRTVVPGGRPRTRLFTFSLVQKKNCMCTLVVTCNALSARRAHRLRDISTEIDAHIIGLTSTRLPFHRPWDGSVHTFRVAQHGRHFEVRWEI